MYFHIVVLRLMSPCSLACGLQPFRGIYLPIVSVWDHIFYADVPDKTVPYPENYNNNLIIIYRNRIVEQSLNPKPPNVENMVSS